MHKEILSREQVELLPLLQSFKREFYLVGGTAIALQIGHRRSIDFDLFKSGKLRPKSIVSKISEFNLPYLVTRNVSEQVNITVSNVKLTFYEYPFDIEAPLSLEHILRMPRLLDLAAMKAYALGRRSKWKDYVDMYFLIKDYFSIVQISERAVQIFEQLFSAKLFRAQLSYFDDVNCNEPVEFLVAEPSESETKQFLIDRALDIQRHMIGISGGGWTTTLCAAIDTRIKHSYPVAGTLPIYLRSECFRNWGDYEQSLPGLYMMGSNSTGRKQFQILNQYDECCFGGIKYRTYENNLKNRIREVGNSNYRPLGKLIIKSHKSITTPAIEALSA